jgi:hypothetical protein
MKPDDRIRLLHIVDALGNAIDFVEGRSREDLDKDTMLGFYRGRSRDAGPDQSNP